MAKAQKAILWGPEEKAGVLRVIEGLKLGLAKPWLVVIKPFYESPSDRQPWRIGGDDHLP